ncbi:hypothetical protein LTR91_000961 [Friedmanniomyces endolithicus]|uniref:Sphingoid long-chain base transporter RSB1 n=1 Tax=Friedmanniomyces endolithicus TaxID=329885 RepID=A0AAN6L4H5_9PEZI|nr:hypothetical protein LTR94_007183 [Friedmanniomyces endolithicus]KAK0790006.1 hypothetical protein LTR38_010738 [Friedmanniomyces endolithicus]KAK0794412.1 hypothetical protein LTR59_007831 [Friedmanniomyces endolithicus]KAK0807272.1 hypothetical protein LTR75_006656 [Friedmanniomyces endolithicus]KAK0845597.1 hypothetical protein LTR03_007345 [Friedmanniomyces endolithicus]
MVHYHQLCTEVTPQCPVSDTTYGYRPNLAANIILLVIFSVCTLAQIFLGVRHRLRAFTVAAAVGCGGEAIGYGGRIMMHANPWSQAGFKVQICCLVLAPSFLAAGIYLTLKHLVIFFGAEKSRIRPGLYTVIFISCDVLSILVQAGGGGIAASDESNLVKIGDDLIVAGISFQMVTMFVCMCLAADFGYRLYKDHSMRDVTMAEVEEGRELPSSFRYYAICSSVAFVCIFIRCIYRVPEMAGGWGAPLMRQQAEFMVLDGAMIATAAILMTVAHPGIFFPAIGSRNRKAALIERDAASPIESLQTDEVAEKSRV